MSIREMLKWRTGRMTQPSNKEHPVKTCLLCNSTRFYYLFSISDRRVVRCNDCGLVFVNPQPAEDPTHEAEAKKHRTNKGSPQILIEFYLSQIHRYRGASTGRLLAVGFGKEGSAFFEKENWQVTMAEPSATWELSPDQFDLCVIANTLGRVRSPLDFLKEIHRVLKPGGTLFIATPSIDSWETRLLQQKRAEIETNDLTYFDRQTLQTTLFKAGFRDVIIQADGLRSAESWGQRAGNSGLMVLSKKAEIRPWEVLSVIVPAFNEAATFKALMDSLLLKELPNLQFEIVVVESNSTDGTRELALKYQDHPRVKLILEDGPRGKGHAVRTGLASASGDYVLIQDADLEYDLEDYDALLEELVTGRHAFVLGSRHGGHNVMKMRQFTGQRGLSIIFNSGHWFFTGLINALFFQKLRDPFTMYKVFRRDCLYGLEFECDRFDFDYELLVKLIRKGYRPIELPVNYRSRSYGEGKKVRMFRDPLNWLKVLIWLRWIKIDPMGVVEKGRRE
jgi:SAM-dependent methyltransferase